MRLFATAREAAGTDRIEWPPAPGGLEIAALLSELSVRYPQLRPVLAHSRLARNGTYLTRRSGRLRPGDELAIHPPYSGG